jgi:phosphate transport system substrate-binding protein
MGGVVLVVNLQGVEPGQLKLDGKTLAGMYLGTIAKWNDPAIARDNANAKLPDMPISVVHRSDGSGTTYVWTDYLSKVSPDWKSGPGTGKSVNWPVGLGGKGNEGVTGTVKQTEGGIGYVELAYANQNKLTPGIIKNREGAWVRPTLESVSQAAAKADMPDDYRVSITNEPGKDAYPIASFTYILVYKDQADPAKGKALLQFLWWAIHDGEKSAAALDYAPLPKPVVEKVETTLKKMTVQGKTVALAASK